MHYCVTLSVEGWTAEVKKFKQRLMELEKERGITQKVCEDQENELKVCTCVSLCTVSAYTASCLACIPQLQRSSHEELNQNLSKLSAEVSVYSMSCNSM